MSDMRQMRAMPHVIEMMGRRRKTLEVRVEYPGYARIRAGDHIRFFSSVKNAVVVKVLEVRRYATIAGVFACEPWEKIAPDFSSKDAAYAILRKIYPPEKEKLGMMVFEIEPVSEVESIGAQAQHA